MIEVWKDVIGYEGIYEVNNLGIIRSVERLDNSGHKRKSKILGLVADRDGYIKVHLCLQGKARYHFVHRIVATAFIDNPERLPQINHKDENKANNKVENLEWCTAKYNINYGKRNILVSESLYGEKAHSSKITQKDVDKIRKQYESRSKENNMKKLAKQYGISESQVWRIINNKRWKVEQEA